MSLQGLRTVLTVAAAGESLSYADLAYHLQQPYEATAHQIGGLSEGRGKRPGQKLLVRCGDTGARQVSCSMLGTAIARRFVTPGLSNPEACRDDLRTRILPAIDAALARQPFSLGTFCVYLYVATHQKDFAVEGRPTRAISEGTGVHNLARHFRLLEGDRASPSKGLLRFEHHDYDGRTRLPRLSDAGLRLEVDLVEAVTGRAVPQVRLPRPEALDRLDSYDDIDQLDEADFTFWPESGEDPAS